MSTYWKCININDLHAAIMKYFNQSRVDALTEDEINQVKNTWILACNVSLNIEDYPISEEGLDGLVQDCLSYD